MSQEKARVLSVGQCSPDHSQITRLVASVGGAGVDAADSLAASIEAARGGGYGLILVNRIFDATGECGLDLIAKLKDDGVTAGTPVMLVSNFADAQAEAVHIGALPGFGKDALAAAETADQLRAALSSASTSKSD